MFDVPELEVLRLTRETRGSYHQIFIGLLSLLLGALTALPLLLVSGVIIFWPIFWVGIPFACYGLFMLLSGTRKLHRTLNSDATRTITTSQQTFRSSVTTALPPAPASVTEATTSLLSSIRDQREKEPIHRKDPNTAEIDTDRLM